MTTQHEALNRDALLAWTVHLSCVMPDGIDEDCQPVSEAQQMRNACPELDKYSDQQLNQFVKDVFTFEAEHPEVSLHRNYIWEPPAGYRGAHHPSDRAFLEWRRKVPRCPTCGQVMSRGQRVVTGDQLRDLIDGLDNVRISLQDGGAAHIGVNVEFTPAEAEELAAFVIKAADFLRELREGAKS